MNLFERAAMMVRGRMRWAVSRPREVNGATEFRLTCRRCGLKGTIYYQFEPKAMKCPTLLPICRRCHPVPGCLT